MQLSVINWTWVIAIVFIYCTVAVGHQKKIMLAIDRLKRINGSLRRMSGNTRSNFDSPCSRHMPSHDACVSRSSAVGQQVSTTGYYSDSVPAGHSPQLSLSMYDNLTPRSYANSLTSFMPPPYTVCNSAGFYRPNLDSVAEIPAVVPVGCEELSNHQVVPIQSHESAAVVDSLGFGSDGGDVTPTNERRILTSRPMDEFNHSSVVARPAAYVVPSPKPVAMVTAKPLQNGDDLVMNTLQSARSYSTSDAVKSSTTNFSYGTLPRKFSQRRQLTAENGDELFNLSYTDASMYDGATCHSQSPASALCLEQPRERFQTDANGNCQVLKKEPPVPPKRTHSFKTDLRLPMPNKHAGLPYTNSISYTTSSCSNGESFQAGNADLFGENILSEVIERLERGTSGGGSSTVRRNTGPRLGDWQDSRLSNDSGSSSEDSDSGLESRRSESNSSLDGTLSCGTHSSADMNTLPFANENVGTIKQRGSSSSKPSVITTSDGGAVQLNSSVFTPTTSSASVPAAAAMS